MNKEEITVEPLSFGLTGFTVKDLLSENFRKEIQKEFPNWEVIDIVFAPIDNPTTTHVFVGHDLHDKKIRLDRVDVQGSDTKLVGQLVAILKRLFQ